LVPTAKAKQCKTEVLANLEIAVTRIDRFLERFHGRTGAPTVVIPEQDADVHDLRGLKAIGEVAVKGKA